MQEGALGHLNVVLTHSQMRGDKGTSHNVENSFLLFFPLGHRSRNPHLLSTAVAIDPLPWEQQEPERDQSLGLHVQTVPYWAAGWGR